MIEIRLLVILNAFKRQADDSDHRRVRVEGKFRCLVGLGSRGGSGGGVCVSPSQTWLCGARMAGGLVRCAECFYLLSL